MHRSDAWFLVIQLVNPQQHMTSEKSLMVYVPAFINFDTCACIRKSRYCKKPPNLSMCNDEPCCCFVIITVITIFFKTFEVCDHIIRLCFLVIKDIMQGTSVIESNLAVLDLPSLDEKGVTYLLEPELDLEKQALCAVIGSQCTG